MEDLDAMYFFDKIQMRSNSVTPTHIPKLDFNFSNSNKNKQEKEVKKVKQLFI